MVGLKQLVLARLAKRKERAEAAYVKASTTKDTTNCQHHGRHLTEKTHVCKIRCLGLNEEQAGQCWTEKARGCADFSLIKTPDTLRAEFRQFSDEELALRWPSIGELFWVLKQIEVVEQNAQQEKRESA